MSMNNFFPTILLVIVFQSLCDSSITIEMAGLPTIDNTGLVNIGNISDFREKVEKMISYKIDKEHDLKDFVHLELEGKLNEDTLKKLINLYIKKFIKISQKYFHDIRHLKPMLIKLIWSWAHQRNREDSLVLMWANIEPGKEEIFVREFTPTLKVFYTFLLDIDILLEDIMHSCPKSYARYLECKKLVEEKHQHNG